MKNDNGFSLIELIIVVAVMAVLIAVIIPNLSKYLSKSKQQADESNKDEIERVLSRACSQSGAQVAEPPLDSWIIFEDGSALYDSTKVNATENGMQNFAGFVASEITRVPKSKITGNYFKVKITKNEQGSFMVEIQ